MKSSLLFFWFIAFMFCTGKTFSSPYQQILSGHGISAMINESSGRLVNITNRITGVTYAIHSDRIRITTAKGTIDLPEVQAKRTVSTLVKSTFKSNISGLEFLWTYHVPEN